jgi:transposase
MVPHGLGVSVPARRWWGWQNMRMPPSSPCPIVLAPDERAALVALAHRPSGPYRLVVRARIVLAAADGASNAGIAADQRLHMDTVRKWRRRFAIRRLGGLADARRPGRPKQFSPVQTAQVKALACELPATRGVPLSRWSAAELADEAVTAGIVADISASTVSRWLAADAINPGGTGRGSFHAIRASPPRPASCWTCTPASGKANRSVRATT